MIKIGALLAAATMCCAADDLLPRDATNLSIRNELETARSKGEEFLRSRRLPDGTWLEGGRVNWVATRFASLALKSPPSLAGPAPSRIDSPMAAWEAVAIARESLRALQNLDRQSPLYGALVVDGKPLELPLLLLAGDALDQEAALVFLSRCEVEPGGYAIRPASPTPSATAAAILMLHGGPKRETALAWLGRHWEVKGGPHFESYLVAKAFGEGLRPRARALAEIVINDQNGDGSWPPAGEDWMEKSPVLVTAWTLLTIERLYQAL